MRTPNSLTLILFFLLSQFALYSADDDEFKPYRNCSTFDCGNLKENVGYPFSNIINPECGSYVINCRLTQEGQSYDVKEFFGHNNTIVVHHQNPEETLHSKNCNFLDDIGFPDSNRDFFSTKLKNPNITVLKCPKLFPAPPPPQFGNSSSRTFEGCEVNGLYYLNPQQPNLPHYKSCSEIQLPFSEPPPEFSIDLYTLYTLLNASISPEWPVPSYGDNKRTTKIAIGVGAGVGGFILACLAFYFFYLRRRKNRRSISSNLISQNISPDSSLKPDPENGSAYFKTPIFSYKELEEATNNFDSNRELGDGGFGTVYRGELRDGRVVAVKRLYENNFKRVEQFMNEVNILSHLRHENLVTLYGCTSRHSRELLLVYEYVPNGTVADHIHGELAKAGLATWPVRMNIAIESAGALKYLHVSEIIHRDVKTNNILLDKSFHVKVADFGLSRLFPTDVTHVSTAPQGTPGYVDPEYYQCYQLTNKSDVYSFGVVLIELISSKPAVDITRHRHDINLANMAINKIQNHSLSDLVDPRLGFETDTRARRMITLVAELAFRCLQQDRDMRPCMDEVYEVLKGIKDEEYNVGKAEEVIDIRSDRDVVGLLKNNTAPFSPVSVTDKWGSVASTPNTSS